MKRLKRGASLIMALVFIICSLFAQPLMAFGEEEYGLISHEMTITPNTSITLYFVGPDGSVIDGQWTSSNPEVADYDPTWQNVNSYSLGTTTISFESYDGLYKDECLVNVIEGINMDSERLFLGGEKSSVQLTCIGLNSESLEGTWTSSDTSVATVDDNGLVTAVDLGTAYIRFSLPDGSFSDSCFVEVKQANALEKDSILMLAGHTEHNDFYNGLGEVVEGTLTSRDTSVVEIDDYNNITAVGAGETIVDFESSDGNYHDSCTVTVLQGFNYKELTLSPDSEPVQLVFYGRGGEVLDEQFYSNDESVATVDENNYVTPVGEGIAHISYDYYDEVTGEYLSDDCRVFVNRSYVFDEDSLLVTVSGQNTLHFLDGNGEYMSTDDLNISVADETIANFYTYETDIYVWGNSKGHTTLTVSTKDGLHSATCDITVFQGLNEHHHKLALGADPVQLVFYDPNDEIINGEFQSYDEKVVTVDSNGNLTPVGTGETTVTFRASVDGVYYYDRCSVKVFNPYTLNTKSVMVTTNSDSGNSVVFIGGDGYEVATEDLNIEVADPSIVSLDIRGYELYVSGKSKGQTTLTVSTKDGLHSDTCDITVIQGLNYHTLSIEPESEPVQLIFYGLNDAIISGNFRDYDTSIINVDENGYITPVNYGSTYVYFDAYVDDVLYYDFCEVTVTDAYTLDVSEMFLAPSTGKPIYFYSTGAAPIADATFEVADPSVASVEKYEDHYIIIGYKRGKTTVTFTTADGAHSAACDVTVAYGINHDSLDLSLNDDPVQLIFSDYDGNPVSGSFEANDPSIVSVDENGYVTPLKEGSTLVTFFSSDYVYNSSTSVTVTEEIVTYELSKTSTILPVKYSEQLELLGSDGSKGTGTWSSSNPTTVSVDQEGNIKALKYGKATIHVEATNGQSFDCEVQTLFEDAWDQSAYYFKAIYWAADHEPMITRGYDLEYFGVGMNCTRKDFMLFLYRMAGQPAVSTATITKDFTDVSSLSNTFKKAIAWGVKQGITKGYSDKTFKPGDSITRKDAMIMLYRYYGKPAPANYTKVSTFTDCKSLNKNTDTYKAIAWAASYGITNGYSTDVPGYAYKAPCFGNSLNILREQMITFLYRAVGKFGESPR